MNINRTEISNIEKNFMKVYKKVEDLIKTNGYTSVKSYIETNINDNKDLTKLQLALSMRNMLSHNEDYRNYFIIQPKIINYLKNFIKEFNTNEDEEIDFTIDESEFR